MRSFDNVFHKHKDPATSHGLLSWALRARRLDALMFMWSFRPLLLSFLHPSGVEQALGDFT